MSDDQAQVTLSPRMLFLPGFSVDTLYRLESRCQVATSEDHPVWRRKTRNIKLTWPNFITIGRFVLVPVFMLAMIEGEAGWAFVIFLIAGLSDALDGMVARFFDQKSELGAYLDPAADKLLLVTAFIMLGYVEALPQWLVLLVVSRDVLIVGAVLLSHLIASPVQMKPLMVSKFNTAFQIALVTFVLAERAALVSVGNLAFVLQVVVVGLTIASATAYLRTWMRHLAKGD